MSLAAMSADSARPGSFLPAIKCSNCGDEIEIARMGEHICASSAHEEPPRAPPTRGQSPNMSNPFTLPQGSASGQQPVAMPSPFQYRNQASPPSDPFGRREPMPVAMPMPYAQAAPMPPSAYSQSPPRNSPYMQPPPPPPPPPMPQQHQPMPVPRVRAPTLTSAPNLVTKPSKMNLPRINPDAANRPFLAPRTPLDAPPSPAISTRSASSNGGKPSLMRSQTSPMPRLYDPRPPSPELSANLDCAFPPFPTAAPAKKERRPSTTSHGRKTPTPGERAPSRGGSRLDQVMNAEPEPFQLPPQSPVKSSPSENVLSKISTMKDGFFSPYRRDGSPDSRDGSVSFDKRRPSVSAADASRQRATSTSFSQPRRPSVPAVPVPSEYTLSNATYSAMKKEAPSRPERPQDGELSPRFLSTFSAEPISISDSDADVMRSAESTIQFPDPKQSEEPSHALSKMHSEPSLQDRVRRPPMPETSMSDPSQVPQSHQLPPRGDSRNGSRMDYRIQNAPPVPRPVQQYRQDSKHASSESGSSTSSASHSMMNSNSSSMSPVGSAASSIEAFSPLSYDAGKYADDDKMRVDGLSFKSPPGALSPIAEQPRQTLPPRNFARPAPPRDPQQNAEAEAMESPMDPAMQHGASGTSSFGSIEPPNPRPFPTRTQTAPGLVAKAIPSPLNIAAASRDYDPYKPRSPLPPIADARGPSRSDSLSADDQTPDSLEPPPIPADSQTRRPPARRGTIGKAVCRGCNKVIEGKSVKAADGRLTGRWHKACFVCRSCKSPFTTADFYVIDNQPYCEHHYHEQNNSLCHGCHRGIEGQYTETTSSNRFGMQNKKYHPRCFNCRECRVVLEEDYFEISGNVFCERHALAAMRAQARLAGPGLGPPDRRGLMAERRTTKLMMMNSA